MLASSVWFLSLAATAVALLWGISIWNGTVKQLLLTTYYQEFEDGTPFLTSYTGFVPLDFPVAVLVAFFYYGTNGSHLGYQHFLLDAYATLQAAFVWLYVEACRPNISKAGLVGRPIVWGLMWQAVGGAIAWPLYFFVHLLWTESQPHQIQLQPVSLPAARALPLSFLTGAILPAVIGMLPTWTGATTTRSPRAHQFILAAWQLDPIWVSILHATLTMLFSSRPCSSERVGHLYVLARMMLSENNEVLSFARMYVPHLAGPGDYTTNQLQLARGPWLFLQYDFIIYSLASLSWVLILLSRMEQPAVSWLGRTKLVLLMALGSIGFGPGTVVSLALWWREGTMAQLRDRRSLGYRGSKLSSD
ncbi:hypothetical protein BDV06DRAFT_235395 [Aspergillus oleicola]